MEHSHTREAREEAAREALGLVKESLEAAQQRIRPHVAVSPLKYSLWLSRLLNAQVYLKIECLNEANSFKIRGATNALLSYRERNGLFPSRVFTASGGNHGIAVAIACHRCKVPCTVALGHSVPASRQQRLEAYGACVLRHGHGYDEANAYSMKKCAEEGGFYLHPFALTDVLLGQGTIALELLEQLKTHDDLVVSASIGGGGLMAGVAAGFQSSSGMKHRPVFIAVETEGADFFSRSMKKGELVAMETITSIALTLGSKSTTLPLWEYLRQVVDHSLTVTDAEAVHAIREILEHERLLVEPATSCVVAAALNNRALFAGKTVVLIVCGASATYTEYEEWRRRFSPEDVRASEELQSKLESTKM